MMIFDLAPHLWANLYLADIERFYTILKKRMRNGLETQRRRI